MTRRTPRWLKIASDFVDEVAARRNDERHFQAEERHRRWERCNGNRIFSLTFVTTGAAVVAGVFAWLAWHTSQDQLQTAQDAQRPYLKPKLTIVGNVENGSIPVTDQVVNVGHSPAQNVDTFIWTTHEVGFTAAPSSTSTCKAIAQTEDAFFSYAYAGVVFPEDTVDVNLVSDEVSLNIRELFVASLPDPDTTVQVQIHFCIDYTSQESQGQRHSNSIFQLVLPIPNSPIGNPNIPIHTSIPADQLKLVLVDSSAN